MKKKKSYTGYQLLGLKFRICNGWVQIQTIKLLQMIGSNYFLELYFYLYFSNFNYFKNLNVKILLFFKLF